MPRLHRMGLREQLTFTVHCHSKPGSPVHKKPRSMQRRLKTNARWARHCRTCVAPPLRTVLPCVSCQHFAPHRQAQGDSGLRAAPSAVMGARAPHLSGALKRSMAACRSAAGVALSVRTTRSAPSASAAHSCGARHARSSGASCRRQATPAGRQVWRAWFNTQVTLTGRQVALAMRARWAGSAAWHAGKGEQRRGGAACNRLKLGHVLLCFVDRAPASTTYS